MTWLAQTVRENGYQLTPTALAPRERQILTQYETLWSGYGPLLYLVENSPALNGWCSNLAHVAALEILRGRIWQDIRDQYARSHGGDIVKSCVWASGGTLGLRGVFCNLDAVLEGDPSHDIG